MKGKPLVVISHILITQLQILEKYLHIRGNYYRLEFFNRVRELGTLGGHYFWPGYLDSNNSSQFSDNIF